MFNWSSAGFNRKSKWNQIASLATAHLLYPLTVIFRTQREYPVELTTQKEMAVYCRTRLQIVKEFRKMGGAL